MKTHREDIKIRAAAIGAGISLLGAASASAQSHSISWWTLDGGGGTSQAGRYSLSGTIGQFDTGRSGSGSYTLDGGFWCAMAVQAQGAPYLEVEQVGGHVVVSWLKPATGWVLETTPALTAPPAAISWSQVPLPYPADSSHYRVTVPVPVGTRYYRLRKL